MDIYQISGVEVLPVRQRVLWPDQPSSFCIVEGDEKATHYGAYIGGKLVCVASVYFNGHEARLRKFATLAEHQGEGIGSAVIEHVIAHLKSLDVKCFWCDARTTARGFYQKYGLIVEGAEFEKSGVLYCKMSVQWE